jgi:hypothetical protein
MKNIMFALLLLAFNSYALTTDEQRIVDILTRTTADNMGLIKNALNHQQQQLQPLCAPLKSIKPQQLSVLTEPTFDLMGKPKSGSWQVKYNVQACGAWYVRSVLFNATEDTANQQTVNGRHEAMGKIALQTLEPGETLTDPALRKDVITQLRTAAARAVPACTAALVKDSRVLEAPKHAKAKWRELWQLTLCPGTAGASEFMQVLSFYPSPMGTMFRMSIPPTNISATVLGQ